MNYLKVQTEVLKRLMKEKKVTYQKENDGYWLLNEQATLAVFVPNCFMFLNVENSKESELTGAISNIYRKEYDYNAAGLTGMSKAMYDPIRGNIDCAEVITTEGEPIRAWLDKKFLKYLEADAKFYLKSETDLILVKEHLTGDRVVAIICPVRDR